MPGMNDLFQDSIARTVFIVTMIGALAGLLFAILWRALNERRLRNEKNKIITG